LPGDFVRKFCHSRASAENPVLSQATVAVSYPGWQTAAFAAAIPNALADKSCGAETGKLCFRPSFQDVRFRRIYCIFNARALWLLQRKKLQTSKWKTFNFRTASRNRAAAKRKTFTLSAKRPANLGCVSAIDGRTKPIPCGLASFSVPAKGLCHFS
jgi:hypothetical protein